MTIVRWDPFREMNSLQHRMNQIFDETLRRREGSPEGGEEIATGTWQPAVDILETPEKIVLRAEVPGVGQDSIDLQVGDGVLTLKGERKFEKPEPAGTFHRVERAYGTFNRSFSLPATVDTERIAASYDAGILTMELPKKDEVKPKRVQVKIGEKKS